MGEIWDEIQRRETEGKRYREETQRKRHRERETPGKRNTGKETQEKGHSERN
jgi:hypothetical protein